MEIEYSGDELDAALHDCMSVIWSSYREALKKHNFDAFNDCFDGLYAKYGDDEAVHSFIAHMGSGLVKAASRRVRE